MQSGCFCEPEQVQLLRVEKGNITNMENTCTINDARWIKARLALLQPPKGWNPSVSLGLVRFRQQCERDAIGTTNGRLFRSSKGVSDKAN